ncbi:unnamed protein product [Cylindrotheca closterium]|uniref:Calmodulin n=1 Tax=Cylindrotheca closterium TaxID=2856 RepID=A0AAD2CQ68_9STRA|nr:unnamed protein product [Cylindrotheca closterium]
MYTLSILLLVLIVHRSNAFTSVSSRTERSINAVTTTTSLAISVGQWQETKKNQKLVESLFAENENDADDSLTSNGRLIPLHLRGQGSLKVSSNITRFATATESKQTVLFLSTTAAALDNDSSSPVSSVLLPLKSTGELKLLSFAVAKRPLSKSLLLTLNGLLVNRDGALFDNLPWAKWSVDPQQRNRDAASNQIDSKFHAGKRDAYYRFMGKDWQGRSAAIGNVALRLKYLLESDENNNSDDDDDGAAPSLKGGNNDMDSDESQTALATRILQLQIRESQMELAGMEAELAAASGDADSQDELCKIKLDLEDKIANMENDMAKIGSVGSTTSATMIGGILENVVNWSTKDGQNAAPYRGATGYAPILDSKEDIAGSLLPYTSPFDLLKEILEDQLNAKVIGCVLENTSLLKGNVVLGGAVVLQRITPKKTTKIMGEEVTINDYEEDYGNPNAKGGEMMIVECDSDEALGMALACNVELSIGSTLFEMTSVLGEEKIQGKNTEHIMDTLAVWQSVDASMSLQVEGERQSQGNTNQSPVSMPGAFDEMSSESKALFPVDSPVKSLDEYDEMTNEVKAKTLLEMSNFNGRLPRPRVVRQQSESSTNPLDELLIPLIDESVRRQFRIRDAERQGDMELAKELRASKSKRQEALERIESARANGEDDLVDQLESESEFLESLRADITQDEGAYSRFLDRDDWYERDRQATAERVKKSSFGTLLDGIE